MSDLIDRQAATDALAPYNAEYDAALVIEECIARIRRVPSVDAVEVVRCRECRWYKTNYMWNGTEVKICAKEAYEPVRKEDDFCSYGER